MKFVGNYTQDLKKLMTASAVSGQNAMFISPPGWGKSQMAEAAAEVVAGSDGALTIEIDPSSPPEIVRGIYDPAAMLAGKAVRLIENTPYDPAKHVVVLDELWRGNDPLFDAFLHATSMNGVETATRPVFWGTSNFVGKAERTAALRDRFAFWYHMVNLDLDVDGIVEAHLLNGNGIDPSWADGLPSWKDCVDIRRTHPTLVSLQAVKDVVNQLVEEAQNEKFDVNPRRVTQWSEILYYSSVLATGSNSFTSVPTDVMKLMQYAYPCTDQKMAGEWRAVALSIGDKVGAAIEAALGVAVEAFKKITKEAAGDPGKKANLAVDLGLILGETQDKLEKLGNDPRLNEASLKLNSIMRKAIRGEQLS